MGRMVVVGGGVAGLFGALLLAERGHRVSVLEAGGWGGRARCPGPDGYRLNLGPHALYPDSLARLQRRGLPVRGGAPDPRGLRMSLEGEVVPLPSGAFGLLSHRALRVSEKLALARWLAAASRGRGEGLHDVSVSDWLDGRGLAGRARKVAEMLVRLTSYAHAPTRLSAGAAHAQLAAGLAGVTYVHGGWMAIVDALMASLSEHDVALRARARVARAVPGEVVLADGTALAADGVLLAVSPKAAARILGPRASERLRSFAGRATPVHAACLDVASEGAPGVATTLLGADAPTYLSVPSVGARVAERGSVAHVARYLTPGAAPPKDVRGPLEESLAVAHPDIAARIVHARYAPAMTVMHALPEAETGGLAGRPDVRDAGPPWAFLAGDWVGPTGMLLDAGLRSAERAADALASFSRGAVSASSSAR